MTTAFSPSPRQARIVLDVLTGLVVISVGVALAGLTWRIAGHAGTGAITVPSGRSGPAVAPDIAPALALAPFGKPSVTEAGQSTGLPLELKGIIAAIPAELSTAFIAVSGQPPKPFHLGENAGGGVIQAILRDRVILTNGGRSEYLAFPDPARVPGEPGGQAATAATTPGTPPPPIAAPAQSSPAAAVAGVLQRFDASPVSGGYRIGGNGPPGMLAGDVIQSVNGTSLSDPAAAQGALAAAQASGSAQIQILRDGKRLTLTVPLR